MRIVRSLPGSEEGKGAQWRAAMPDEADRLGATEGAITARLTSVIAAENVPHAARRSWHNRSLRATVSAWTVVRRWKR